MIIEDKKEITLLESINTVIEENKIETGGAYNEHIIEIEYKNDGDSYYEIKIPFWSQNNYVVKSCLDLINKLINASLGLGTSLYLRDNKFVIHIFESFCDPD